MDKQQKEKSFLGSGWSFPVTFSAGSFQLSHSSYEKNINESIELILRTKNGERCFEPQFGSGLNQFYFRTMDGTLKGEIQDAVSTALLINEPRITVANVTVDFADITAGLVEISINYTYNQTNTRLNFVFPFHLKEGTNLVR